MGVSADTGGTTDLQVAFNGGEDFIRRIGELKDATARHEDALNRLGLGVAAKDVLAQESSRLTAADTALSKARSDAADIIKKAESDRDAMLADAKSQSETVLTSAETSAEALASKTEIERTAALAEAKRVRDEADAYALKVRSDASTVVDEANKMMAEAQASSLAAKATAVEAAQKMVAAETLAQEAAATKIKYVDFAGQLRRVLAKIPNE